MHRPNTEPTAAPATAHAEAASAHAKLPGTIYAERRDRFSQLSKAATARENRIAHGRLITFAVAVLGLLAAYGGAPELRGLGRIAFAMGALGYAALVVRHRRVLGERERWEALAHYNALALARLARDFAALPPFAPLSPKASSVSIDLDLTGPASLLQLVSTAQTLFGQRVLADWLATPALPEVIRERQGAVAELAPELDLRDQVGFLGMKSTRGAWDAEGFVRWAEGAPWLNERPWLRRVAPVLGAITTALALLDLLGWYHQRFWLAGAAANLLLTWAHAKAIHGSFSQVESRQEAMVACARTLSLIEASGLKSPTLLALRARIRTGGLRADRELTMLGRLIGWTELRRTPLLYLPIQALTLWDVHFLAALERWQARVGGRARGWLETLGEFEALSSLAALAHAHPTWVFPSVTDSKPWLQAEGLGHPLLAEGRRVDNDLAIGPPGTFVLLTGSNMSGKSTLLRAVGLNVLLAQAGSVVCARGLRLTPLRVASSLRVQDSLEAGLSRFMAELSRLREVVVAAQRAPPSQGILYLLDEVLSGTNAPERRAAVPILLRRLLRTRAIGILTTHDPEIIAAPDVSAVCDQQHFTDTVRRTDGQVVISFDYRLRPGMAPAGNALAFLEALGLDLDEEEDEPEPEDDNPGGQPPLRRTTQKPAG